MEGNVLKLCAKYPLPTGIYMPYGTAGFRDKASKLDHVMARMGVLAGLRSISCDGKCIGLMLTASHNPKEDNGVKLIDPAGEMLHADWEPIVTRFVNAPDAQLYQEFLNIFSNYCLKPVTPSVAIGYDTRESASRLTTAAKTGLDCFETCEVFNFGLVATPQLHFCVSQVNALRKVESTSNGAVDLIGRLSDAYFNQLAKSFQSLLKLAHRDTADAGVVYVDTANGVGAVALQRIAPLLKGHLELKLFNDCISAGRDGFELNHLCGADYVKIQQKLPVHCPLNEVSPRQRFATFDGDADRLLYFFVDDTGSFQLLDGDKIAILIMQYIQGLCKQLQLLDQLKLGLIQTAYANGASTEFVRRHIGLPVFFTPTGVKYLHHAAQHHFDIGVYFEANGHGTVLFSAKANEVIENRVHAERAAMPNGEAAAASSNLAAAEKLYHLSQLINQTVGDALSDMLVVEAILFDAGLTVAGWSALYAELASVQLKVQVPDRAAFVTRDAERALVSPAGLQEVVDGLVEQHKQQQARCFVRPSGTEDVVRIYAEATSPSVAQHVAAQVQAAIVRSTTNKA